MIDCRKNVTKRLGNLKQYVDEHSLSNKCLAVIQIGDNAASNSYIKGKKSDCEFIGIQFKHIKLSEDVNTLQVLNEIKPLNADEDVLGVIVQLPIPQHLDEQVILNSISDDKDVDGFKVTSQFEPCTPKGVLSILEDIEYDVQGKTVCVIGKGKTVGMPLVPMLMQKGATVISCNSKTPKYMLNEFLNYSDVWISAVGKPNLITVDAFKENDWSGFFPDVIIDVGICRDENGKLCGDFSKEFHDWVDLMTPTPGGSGLYTRVSLLENTIYGGCK